MSSDQPFDRLKGHIAALKSTAREGRRQVPERPFAGMTFFLRVPREDAPYLSTPQSEAARQANREDAHALLAVIRELGHGHLLCAKLSLEIAMAGPYDLRIEPHEWVGGYAVIAEAWNTLVVHAGEVDNHHGDLPPELTGQILILFEAFQRGDLAAPQIPMTGPPLEDFDERLDFQEREAVLIERARRFFHERPPAEIIKLPVSPTAGREKALAESLRACADVSDLESGIREAWQALERDTLVYETDEGSIYVRVERERISFIWFSEQGSRPPAIETRPRLTSPEQMLSDGTGVLLGSIDPDPDLRDVILAVGEPGRSRRLIVEWD
jgi:hypothetical protein